MLLLLISLWLYNFCSDWLESVIITLMSTLLFSSTSNTSIAESFDPYALTNDTHPHTPHRHAHRHCLWMVGINTAVKKFRNSCWTEEFWEWFWKRKKKKQKSGEVSMVLKEEEKEEEWWVSETNYSKQMGWCEKTIFQQMFLSWHEGWQRYISFPVLDLTHHSSTFYSLRAFCIS